MAKPSVVQGNGFCNVATGTRCNSDHGPRQALYFSNDVYSFQDVDDSAIGRLQERLKERKEQPAITYSEDVRPSSSSN